MNVWDEDVTMYNNTTFGKTVTSKETSLYPSLWSSRWQPWGQDEKKVHAGAAVSAGIQAEPGLRDILQGSALEQQFEALVTL
ncbi:MAG: hypothetical protein H0A75_08850 [Candidatus Methanofishera endochildressiae]|uniref:Uncharacterized protein n=1 Tax=Candidatus Methanofishera endochildressiae TaxID=2738884 RepID=A0A7Z0MPT0_9GAMM|nr:hypothetical protein [Candidatus Methanofishera endochildressiae]